MPTSNHGVSVNIGHNSKLNNDNCAINDLIAESTAPLAYRLNDIQQYNCNACLSTLGPRTSSGIQSYGVSSVANDKRNVAQNLVDLESVLTNRNVPASKCKDSHVNKQDLSQYRLNNAQICGNFLNPIATHLTNPAINYKEVAINRFYDLPKNPQANVYYPSAINTKLEAKDNYRPRLPCIVKNDPSLPKECRSKKQCIYKCYEECNL